MEEEKDKKEYELGFWVKDDSGLEKVKALMADFGLEPTYTGELKRMQFAYPIKKETSGIFASYHFKTDIDNLRAFEKELKVSGDCLRFLVSNNPMKKTEEREYRRPSMEKKPEKVEQKPTETVTNEELEKKLEEILK